jgi:hypothetical protein
MLVEVFGFMAGLARAAAAGLAFIRIERGRSVAAVYGLGRAGPRGGNALIWPSH